MIYIDPDGLRQVVTVGVSGTAQVGLLPVGFGVGGGISGGQSIGLSIPNDWADWICYQLVWQSNALAGLGLGTFFGVGVGVSASTTGDDAPLPNLSTSNTAGAAINAGLGPSAGATAGTDGSKAFTEGSLSGWQLGVGVGAGAFGGLNTTTIKVLIDTIGDECECQ